MSDTTDVLPTERTSADTEQGAAPAVSGGSATTKPRRRTAGLSGMVLPELQKMALGLGISGTGRMRKGDLIAAIQNSQNPSSQNEPAHNGRQSPVVTNGTRSVGGPAASVPVQSTSSPAESSPPAQAARSEQTADAAETGAVPARRSRRAAGRPAGAPEGGGASSGPQDTVSDQQQAGTRQGADRQRDDRTDRQDGSGRPSSDRAERQGNDRAERQGGDRQGGDRQNGRQSQNNGGGRNNHDDDGGDGGRRRGRRFRDRNRRGGSAGGSAGGNGGRDRFGSEAEPEVREDDVLIPVAGIVDILDNYAFVRTSGYLTGPDDVYVSMNQVRKNGLRRGDAVTGAVRQPREGERHDKFNALIRLDTVNGVAPDESKKRPEFFKLTPLYPQERLRLETESNILTTRIIDLVVPIGKGQRALIVSPPKAGKTMVLQAIANAITTNNPECHLMVVLVDERPEEVTDMQRSVKGEVIASTFDRPPSDHTTVAELSIERAKRLVELGHDVVVLLDSITRLGRAYNNASPASGRILSGGIDSTALYPPKRFLGAARNIENGGSLTILSTALVETGSTGDTVIYEEFKGTGNAELYLDRKIANRRIFPAVDVVASGTRKEEILMSPEEQVVVNKLRRVLHSLEPQAALELLLERLKKTTNNIEFLMQIQKTTLGSDE